jgi:diguanylate cyclase (GGDEF)-like protein
VRQRDPVQEQISEQRVPLFRVMLVIMIIAGSTFAWLNLQRQEYPLALAELGAVLLSAVLLLRLRQLNNLRFWYQLFVFALCSAVLVGLFDPTATATLFVWVLGFPLLTHFLLGSRLGLINTAVFMSLATALYLQRFAPGADDIGAWVEFANVAICGLLFVIVSHAYERYREQTVRQLLDMAWTDPLTGLRNRARLEEIVEQQLALAGRGQTLSLLLIDVDHFKDINDRYGHEAGDRALVVVAGLIAERMRRSDYLFRVGGEEFLALLPGCDLAQAAGIATEIRELIADSTIEGLRREELTVSIGVAQHGPDGEDFKTLFHEADQRLYQGKQQGRNHVEAGRQWSVTTVPSGD